MRSVAASFPALPCCAFLACLFLSMSVHARPNDASVGGQGADLVLLSEGRIRMASEDIRLVQKREGASDWIVYAHYVFENPTGEAVTIRMGFPEMAHCDGDAEDYGDSYDPRFRNLQTSVRGVPVEHSTGTVKKSEWDFCLGTVYVFDVTFAPYERLEVDHSYEYTGSSDVMGVSVDYLTRTGSLWNGPIGRAEFTVAIAGLPVRVSWPKEYNLTEQYQYRDRFPTDPYGEVRTIYRFRQENWTPGRNFGMGVILFYDDLLPECCPQQWDVMEVMGERNAEERIREITACLPDDSLRICRNTIYARYGRPFTDTALLRRFYAPPRIGSLYGFSDEENDLLTVGYQPNPRYSDDLLTSEEKNYVVLLRKIEEERKGTGGSAGE